MPINQIAEELRQYVVALSDLKPASRNARLHPADNLVDIKDSLEKFGQDQVIVYRKADREIIKGNGRYMAMQALGWTECAAIGVDDDEIKAMARAIADNRAGETSEWDDALLGAELQKLIDSEYADATGFSADEMDRLIKDIEGQTEADAAAREPVDETKADELQKQWGTAVGQLWRIGDHFLMIGDSTDPQQVANLMQGDQFTCVFTDPPYGISYDTANSRPNNARKWKQIKNDALNEDALEDFCRLFLANLYRFGVKDWVGYICFATATMHVLRSAMMSLSIPFNKVPIIWVKQRFSLTWDRYKPMHEVIYHSGPGYSSRWFGENNETAIWDVKRDANADYVHPTQKPVELPERGFRNSTQVGEIVLDLFGGSGTTMVAAHLNKRKARLMEFDPGYAAVILERMKPLVQGDIEKVDVMPFDVPPGPEQWSSRMYRLAADQAQIVDQALRVIGKTLKGKNTEARALEMLAADFLAGHPEAVVDEADLAAEVVE